LIIIGRAFEDTLILVVGLIPNVPPLKRFQLSTWYSLCSASSLTMSKYLCPYSTLSFATLPKASFIGTCIHHLQRVPTLLDMLNRIVYDLPQHPLVRGHQRESSSCGRRSQIQVVSSNAKLYKRSKS
jgi:hypothetical protein